MSDLDTLSPPGTSAVSSDVLRSLTADDKKHRLYLVDPYLREGLLHFSTVGALSVAHDLAFVVLKPDAVAGRRCQLIVDTLRERGWLPVAATTARFDPLLTREVWRYQFNAASEQRIAVVDHLLGSGDSLLVLLTDHQRPDWLPASVRLTAQKGAADPTGAHRADLRQRFGRVNGLFNFIHTADDPADLVRQLQLFAFDAGWDWCAEALTKGAQTDPAVLERAAERVATLVADLEAQIPAHDLDLRASLERLRHRDDEWGAHARRFDSREHIGEWLATLARVPLPPGAARWDLLTVLTCWIECNEPNVAAVIPTARPDEWLSAR
ncbi:hypothetical protein ABGB16_13355 [Micromonospora sp. B11E3]|uniref:hypothetical protein n=1 Tax=Micromonospora sp. B11E3 TaxID=3153562 RepID=UPI00325D0F9C